MAENANNARSLGEQVVQANLAVHAAATATEARSIFTAPCACVVRDVSYTPDVASTGDNTNTTNLNVINKGAAGSGTTEVGNLDLATGTDLVAFDNTRIPLNSTYADGVTLAKGDVIALQFEKVSTGVLVGPGLVTIRFVPKVG